MPTSLSTTAVLALFYLVFASQIFLISVHYAGKLRRRVEYVLDNFPPESYPKLYPAHRTELAAAETKRALRVFRAVNYAIALLGVAILAAMVLSGYRPDLKGGDEVFVLMYFMLQVSPLLYAELQEMRQYRLMRRTFASRMRKADLSRRRLFDFVSPTLIATAVLLYVACLAYYLSGHGYAPPWESEVYVTLITITGTNLLFAAMIARYLYGKKANPYQAHEDQLRQLESVAKVMVFASIGISAFFMLTVAVDRYAWELFDPPLTSLYLQLCVAFGIGHLFRTLEIDSIDFEGYKEDAVQAST